jgi:hypothetical protein
LAPIAVDVGMLRQDDLKDGLKVRGDVPEQVE